MFQYWSRDLFDYYCKLASWLYTFALATKVMLSLCSHDLILNYRCNKASRLTCVGLLISVWPKGTRKILSYEQK